MPPEPVALVLQGNPDHEGETMSDYLSGSVYLRQLARGDRWYARVRIGNRDTKKCIGPAWQKRTTPPAGYFTRTSAERWLRDYLTDVGRGLRIEQPKTGATWGEACREWLRWIEHDRRRKRSTVRDYKLTIDANLIPDLGEDRTLETIQPKHVEAYRDVLLARGKLTPRTINKRLTIIHGVFKRATKVWDLKANPAVGVEKVPERRSGDIEVLRPDEVRQLAAHAETDQDAALYVTAAFTGLRFGELAALRWSDIDWQRSLIHVRRALARGAIEEPKSGKVRSVPMVPEVSQALAKLGQRDLWIGDHDFVFTSSTGSYIDHSATVRTYKRALRAAGLRPIKFHGLRHSFGTLAVQAFPLSDVQAWMGHADIATTMRYVHYVPKHDAAQRLGRLLSDENVAPSVGPNSDVPTSSEGVESA
jgi:integrase